jgi:hypothetical protein
MADFVLPGFLEFSSDSRDFWDFHRTPEILGFSSYFKDYYRTRGIFRDSESRESAISPLKNTVYIRSDNDVETEYKRETFHADILSLNFVIN